MTNIYRILANDSRMCGYFCIGFVDFMVQGRSLLDCKNLFSPNEYEKNVKIILRWKKVKMRKNLRWKFFLRFLLYAVNVRMNIKKYLKKKNQLRQQKFLV